MKRIVGVLAVAVATTLVGGALAATSPVTVVFVSGPDWGAFAGDPAGAATTFFGQAQDVCLSEVQPPTCPSGATIYIPGGGSGIGWAADLSAIPGAAWIWAPGIAPSTSPADFAHFYFSRTIALEGTPVAGTISVAVDDSAIVRINGRVAGRWGSTVNGDEAGRAQSALKSFNITAFLKRGRNVITIEGQNGPPAFAGGCGPCSYAQNPAGVVFGGTLTYRR